MENPKNVRLDLRRFNSAFITNIKSQATGIVKRCICIPIEDNFIEEAGYTDRAGKEIRTATAQCKMWPVSEESRTQYGKKHDWELRLDISKNQRDALANRDPQLAARLSYNNNAYDKELSKQLLPYIGQAFEIQPTSLPPETASTTTVDNTLNDANDDLPF